MAFANVGSAEGIFAAVSSNLDSVSAVSVPSLGANRVGIVLVSLPGGVAITASSVTWNGDDMGAAVISASSSNRNVYIFALVGMDHNGSYDIAVTYNTTAIHDAHITVAWADATNAISLDDTSTETGTAQNPDIVSSQATAGELVVSVVATDNNGGVNAPTGATALQNHDFGGNCSSSAYSIEGSSGDATHTHNFAQAASSIYAIVSASFKETAAGGGAFPDHYYRLMRG